MAGNGLATDDDMPRLELESLRQVLAVSLILGAVFSIALAAIWLVGDFVATAAYSPNLDEATQVADFNDLGYIAESMAGYRFQLGFPVILMSIAMLLQAVLLLQHHGNKRFMFAAGGFALFFQVLVLTKVFYWPFFLFFLLSAVGLYLISELEISADAEELEPATREEERITTVQAESVIDSEFVDTPEQSSGAEPESGGSAKFKPHTFQPVQERPEPVVARSRPKRVWNMLDWMILALILSTLVGIFLVML